jgi:hypothetical protein
MTTKTPEQILRDALFREAVARLLHSDVPVPEAAEKLASGNFPALLLGEDEEEAA